MPKSRFYTPRQIMLCQGVTSRQASDRTDLFTGNAEDLNRAGVLSTEMLPPEGSWSIAWRPVGQQRKCSHAENEPGYIVIHRSPAGRFRAYVTVSLEEQERRRAATKERKEKWEREEGPARRGQEAKPRVSFNSLIQSTDELRERARAYLRSVRVLLLEGKAPGPFQFCLPTETAADAKKMLYRLAEFIDQGPISVDYEMAARAVLDRVQWASKRQRAV